MSQETVTLPETEDLKTFRARVKTYREYVAASEFAGVEPLSWGTFGWLLDIYDKARNR